MPFERIPAGDWDLLLPEKLATAPLRTVIPHDDGRSVHPDIVEQRGAMLCCAPFGQQLNSKRKEERWKPEKVDRTIRSGGQ
eukprot:SAG31_NODE_57_length_29727_cov_12.584568_13_plen_81_part_00